MSIGKLIGQGRTAEVFEWDGSKILKLFREGIPKNIVEYEYRISLELSKHNLPAAEVYELIEHANRYGIVYERIDGISMMKIMSQKPWNLSKHAKNFAQLHFDIQKSIEYDLIKLKDRLIENITKTDLLEGYIKDVLKDYIGKLPDGDILCHGDFHPDNILVSKNKFYVIDWMTAVMGTRAADIARTVVLLKFAELPEDKPFLEKRMINFFRKALLNRYLKNYTKISNVSIEEIEKWELPIAAARLVEWVPGNEKDALITYIKEKVDKI